MRSARPMIVLTGDARTALAFWLMREHGLEVPVGWSEPEMTLLEDTNRGQPSLWRRPYFTEGGSAWPDRWLMTVKETAPC